MSGVHCHRTKNVYRSDHCRGLNGGLPRIHVVDRGSQQDGAWRWGPRRRAGREGRAPGGGSGSVYKGRRGAPSPLQPREGPGRARRRVRPEHQVSGTRALGFRPLGWSEVMRLMAPSPCPLRAADAAHRAAQSWWHHRAPCSTVTTRVHPLAHRPLWVSPARVCAECRGLMMAAVPGRLWGRQASSTGEGSLEEEASASMTRR